MKGVALFVVILLAAIAGYLLGGSRAQQDAPASPTFDDYLADLPRLAVPIGNGQISGVVRDASDAPLAGVRVVAEARSPDSEGAYDDDPTALPTLEAEIRDDVQYRVWSRALRRSATTDAKGRFTLTEIPDLMYHVIAAKPGYTFKAEESWRVRAGAELFFTASPLVRQRITLDGYTPERDDRIRIEWNRHETNSSSSRFWSPERPWIELEPGTYTLKAKLWRGELTGESEPSTVQLVVGREPEALNMPFGLSAVLRVRIEAPPGLAGNDVGIEAQRIGPRGEVIGRPARDWESKPLEIHDLEPGRYRVTATWIASQKQGSTKTVELRRGMNDIPLALEAPDPKEWLVLRVEDPDGAALTDAQYTQRYRDAEGNGRGSGLRTALHSSDGRCFLEPLDPDGQTVAYRVEIVHPKFGRLLRDVDPAATEPVVARFAAPAFVDVTVARYADSGARAFLRLEPGDVGSWSWGWRPEAVGKLAADGTQRLGPVQPGAHDVVLFLDMERTDAVFHGGREGGAYLTHDRLLLKSGIQNAHVAMPKLYTARVKWEGEGKPSLTLKPVTEESLIRRSEWSAAVGDDGYAQFRFVPAGKYEVLGTEFEVPIQLEVTVK